MGGSEATTDMVECPTCRGSGWVPAPWADGPGCGYDLAGLHAACEDCHGLGHLRRKTTTHTPPASIDIGSLVGKEDNMARHQDRSPLVIQVYVLLDGRMEPAEPTGDGSYVYRAGGDGPTVVHGAIIDDRYRAGTCPDGRRMQPGEEYLVTADEVAAAISEVEPVRRHPTTGIQEVEAVRDVVTGECSPVDPAGIVVAVCPAVLLDPPETPAMWARRTYTDAPIRKAGDTSYERDLVLRSPAGVFRLVGCRRRRAVHAAALPPSPGARPTRRGGAGGDEEGSGLTINRRLTAAAGGTTMAAMTDYSISGTATVCARVTDTPPVVREGLEALVLRVLGDRFENPVGVAAAVVASALPALGSSTVMAVGGHVTEQRRENAPFELLAGFVVVFRLDDDREVHVDVKAG